MEHPINKITRLAAEYMQIVLEEFIYFTVRFFVPYSIFYAFDTSDELWFKSNPHKLFVGFLACIVLITFIVDVVLFVKAMIKRTKEFSARIDEDVIDEDEDLFW